REVVRDVLVQRDPDAEVREVVLSDHALHLVKFVEGAEIVVVVLFDSLQCLVADFIFVHRSSSGPAKIDQASSCRGYLGVPQPRKPMKFGSGCSSTPKFSRTFAWISRTSSTTSRAVPPPRLTTASVCFDDSPTLPSAKPLWNPERSISHAAESFT